MIDSTRPAAVAGTFYPHDSRELRQMVAQMLAEAGQRLAVDATSQGSVPALIAPHAGYIYSGPIAASAYHYVTHNAADIDTVVLLGPAHRVPVTGCACPADLWFETPLGKVAIAREQLQQLLDLKLVYIDAAAHQFEHSLEVHIPFLQTIFKDFALLPLVVGNCEPELVADIIARVSNKHSLIVISSDLSHFLDYDTANRRDSLTSAAIERLDYPAIGPEDACGCMPLSGMLLHAHRHGLHIRTVDRRNSGDTAGDKRRVVGYGAYIVSGAQPA